MLKKLFVVSLLAIGLSFNAFAQDGLKIAYVNMDKAMNSSTLAKSLMSEFEAGFAKKAKEIKSLEAELRNARQQAVKESLTMSQGKKEELQSSLLKKDRELRFKKSVFDEDAKLANGKINRKVEQAVLKVVSEITKQEKYDLVLISDVLFSSKRVDITDKVIAKLQ